MQTGETMEWYLGVWKKFAVFSGRARRKEYWMFFLFNIIAVVILTIGDGMIGRTQQGIGILTLIYDLAVLIPSLAVAVRRLHDTDRTGWWLLIALVPLIGVIVLLVFFCIGGTKGSNRFGADPIGAAAPA